MIIIHINQVTVGDIKQITGKSNLNVAKLPRDTVTVTMFVQFYRSKVGESCFFFFSLLGQQRKSFSLFVFSMSPLPHLQFWIIILEKMPE